MLGKIHLHAAGQLPPSALGVPYSEIKDRTLAGAAPNWAHAHGTPCINEECHIWNRCIAKLDWRDERSQVLPQPEFTSRNGRNRCASKFQLL
jgi:hypothetical protein